MQADESTNKQFTTRTLAQKNRDVIKGVVPHTQRLTTEAKSSRLKVKSMTRNSLLADGAIEKDAYTPLTVLNRAKLANHLEELAFTVIDSL